LIFGDDYKHRLQEYCQRRVREEGSIRAWTCRIGVDKTTAKPWLEGTLTEPIRLHTLLCLAWDRNETPEQTRDWLEGKPSLVDQIRELPHHVQASLLAELMHQQVMLLKPAAKDGEIPLVRSQPQSCTLPFDKEVVGDCEMSNTRGFELIEVGSPRHLKLKAILVATLRIKNLPLENLEEEDLEAIADAMGYDRSEPLRFNAGLEMLESFLKTDEGTLDAVGDYHLVYLANFCHRLTKYYEFPAFHAVCDEILTYEGDVEQLLSDVTRNGALIG